VDATLHEIAYALDALKADGIAFLTSYGDKWLGDPPFAPVMDGVNRRRGVAFLRSYGDKWLGDPAVAPVMDELNRRRAVAYTHPTTANCCGKLIPDVPESIIEWGTDTSRTIASIVFSGTAQRCRDIAFIFSHGGGTMP